MGSLGVRTPPCINCGKYRGFYMKRGRSKAWTKICKGCDLKYYVRVIRVLA